MQLNDCDNPNALAPQTVTITLNDGQQFSVDLPQVLGNPARPLSREQHVQKFRRCCQTALSAFDQEQVERFITQIDNLEQVGDMTAVMDLTVAKHQH